MKFIKLSMEQVLIIFLRIVLENWLRNTIKQNRYIYLSSFLYSTPFHSFFNFRIKIQGLSWPEFLLMVACLAHVRSVFQWYY